MTNSKSPNSSDPSASNDEAVPGDLRALDAALSETLRSSVADSSPPGLAERVFEASVVDLPTKVLPFESEPRIWRFSYVGYAAMILVSVLAFLAITQREGDLESDRVELAGATLEDFKIEGPRDSEVMLVAVLDPDEGWFEEDQFHGSLGGGLDIGVGAILHSRMFGVDELSSDVLAMLGGPAS